VLAEFVSVFVVVFFFGGDFEKNRGTFETPKTNNIGLRPILDVPITRAAAGPALRVSYSWYALGCPSGFFYVL